MKITIKEQYEGKEPQWFNHFEGQIQNQEVYLSLTPDGVVTVDYSRETNRSTIPSSVWNNFELRWALPDTIHGDGVMALVEEIKPNLLTILDGWDTDGLNGELYEEAEEASLEVKRTIVRFGHGLYCSQVAILEDVMKNVKSTDISQDNSKDLATVIFGELSYENVYPAFTEEDLINALEDLMDEQRKQYE